MQNLPNRFETLIKRVMDCLCQNFKYFRPKGCKGQHYCITTLNSPTCITFEAFSASRSFKDIHTYYEHFTLYIVEIIGPVLIFRQTSRLVMDSVHVTVGIRLCSHISNEFLFGTMLSFHTTDFCIT